MTGARRLLAPAGAALAALTLAGCASTVDPRSGENVIRRLVARSPTLGRLTSVSCPGGLAPKVGSAFACRVTVSDHGRSVTGTITVHIIQGQQVAIFGTRDLSGSLQRALSSQSG